MTQLEPSLPQRPWFPWTILFLIALLGLVIVGILPGASTTLALMVMPAGLLWLLGSGITLWFWLTHRYRCAVLSTCAVLAYMLAGSPVVGNLLLRTAENTFTQIDPFAEHYDVVLVLGGGTASRGSYNYLGASGDRVMLGARLWYQGNTPLLISSGNTKPDALQQHDSSDITRTLWEEIGIPASAILRLSAPTDTRQEMQELAKLQQQHQWKRIGVVSSARHLPRVLKNARAQQLQILPLPADYRTSDGVIPIGLRGIIPTSSGFEATHLACWEWLARTVGH